MSTVTLSLVSLALPASARILLQLRMVGGGLLYAYATHTIFADEIMAVRMGVYVWLGFIQPYEAGLIKLVNLRGESGWFDLAEVELLRLISLE